MTRHAKEILKMTGASAWMIYLSLAGITIISLVVVFWCSRVSAEGTNTVVNWPPPPAQGSIQWQFDQENAKKRQEMARMRVPIPAAAFGSNVPRANDAFPVMPTMAQSTPMAMPEAPKGMFSQFFLFSVVFGFALLFAVKKFAPGRWAALNRQYNPWYNESALTGALQGDTRAEETAFKKFLAAYQSGPAPAKDSAVPEIPFTEFYQRVAKLLAEQRLLFKEISREGTDNQTRQKKLVQLNYDLGKLKEEAVSPEVLPMWQAASALEGFIRHLIGKMGSINASTLRTVGSALELLEQMCTPGTKLDWLTRQPLKFLVVDDEMISRHAMSLALKKAFGEPDLAVNGEEALAKTGGQGYDVIFLDVQMPGMDGFELCSKIRETANNRQTPIIFVTGQSDYEARSKSTLSGGNDLLGKPFLIFEITVKALTLAFQGRLERQKAAQQAGSASKAGETTVETARETESPTVHIEPLRDFCRAIQESTNEAARQSLLADALLRVTSLMARNNSMTRHPTTQICSALEGLLKKMLQNIKNSTPSAVATVSAAVDLLYDLCESVPLDGPPVNSPVNILVVDDDLVTRRVMVGALQTYFTKPESVENGEEALVRAMEKPYDIIFMDIMMPGMDGFETCKKIRETAFNQDTPVVFVTSNDDFETRSRMQQDSGDELMGKPFLIPEIIVKALTIALRNRIREREAKPQVAAAV